CHKIQSRCHSTERSESDLRKSNVGIYLKFISKTEDKIGRKLHEMVVVQNLVAEKEQQCPVYASLLPN
ncbi:hypothetical protein DOY81_010181, partial [Sarcophaga bullata]